MQEPSPQKHQQSWNQRQGRGDGDQNDGHARYTDGPQDVGSHEHQAQQRHGHCQSGEQHSAPGCGQRRRHALGDERIAPTGASSAQASVPRGFDVIAVAGELLAVARGQ